MTQTKKKITRTNDIEKWCREMIKGPRGFISFEEREWPMYTKAQRDIAIAEFMIRCLANIDNEGSDYVLNSIITRRHQQGESTVVEKAFLAGRSKTSWAQFKKDNDL